MTAIGSFKGKATITLEPDSKYPFTFGTTKAKLILANLDAIRAFVAAHEPKPASTTPTVNPQPATV